MAASDAPRQTIRLLEPAVKVGETRLDALPGRPSHGLGKADYMFMALVATELELEGYQWAYACLPQRSGPKPKAGSDVAEKHRHEVQQLCQAAGLSLSLKPWRIRGDLSVDTRMLLQLEERLRASVGEGDVDQSLATVEELHARAPQLREATLPEKWPLGNLIATVSREVPPRTPDADVAEFRRHAMEVTGLGRLANAIKSAKCELPRSVFESLLQAERIEDARRVLAWIAPSYSRRHGLDRKLRERAAETGRELTEPAWVGICGGPSRTTIAAPTVGGVVVEASIAVGLGGAMDRHALAQSAERVMDELVGMTGRHVRNIVVGCAGYDREDPRELHRALKAAASRRELPSDLWVANDGDLLLFAPPLLGSGVALIADMGSVVVARHPPLEASMARRGGGEWLLSDVGSGFSIAHNALCQTYDQVNACTFGARLTDEVFDLVVAACDAFGEPSPMDIDDLAGCRRAMERIARYEAVPQNFDKSRIASFAKPVLGLADAGNAVARNAVEGGARRLGRHLAEALAWHPDPRPSMVVVGFLAADEIYFEALRRGVHDCLSAGPPGLSSERVEAKLAGLCRPATDAVADARVDDPAILYAEVARMLDASASELSEAQAQIVGFLRGPRSRSIVTHIRKH